MGEVTILISPEVKSLEEAAGKGVSVALSVIIEGRIFFPFLNLPTKIISCFKQRISKAQL